MGIFTDTSDMLWYVGQVFVFIFLTIYCILMLQSAAKSEPGSQKDMFNGFSGFIAANICNQGIFLVHSYYRQTGIEILPRVITIGGTGYEYLMLIWFALSFIFIMKPIEKYLLQKEKLRIYKLNIVSFIMVAIPYIGGLIHYSLVGAEAFFLNPKYEWWTFAAYPGVGFFGLSALISVFGSFIFYLRLGFTSTGLIRKKGFFLGFGILMVYIGILVGSNLRGYLSVIFGPGIMVMGGILVIFGHKIQV